MSVPFYKRIWQKPPIAFPLIALGHLVYLFYLVIDSVVDPVGGMMLAQPAIMLVYTIAWLLVCDMKKWAAITYMAVTTVNLWIRFILDDEMSRVYFTDVLFPADIVFAIIAMLFYKKMD